MIFYKIEEIKREIRKITKEITMVTEFSTYNVMTDETKHYFDIFLSFKQPKDMWLTKRITIEYDFNKITRKTKTLIKEVVTEVEKEIEQIRGEINNEK